MSAKTFEGVMTALVTPMRDGRVDLDALSALVEAQIAGGVDGLVALGTTGESATVTDREHAQVVEHTVKVAAGRVPVIAGAGANSTAHAIALSRASEQAGADGLLHVNPYYNKPPQAGICAHYQAIADACGLPIILYNVPSRTAADLDLDTVSRLAEIDRVVAIKEATGDMRRAHNLIARLGDGLAVLSGDDFTACSLFLLGGRGVISVVSNAVPDRMAAVWRAASSGDANAARAAHASLMPLCELLFTEPNPIPVKAAVELLGLCGPELRLPLVPASAALRGRIRDWLDSEGLLGGN